MAAGDYLTWAVQSQDAPAHVARILQTILLNEGVVDVAGGSFEVTEDTGSNMNITVGSGTLGDLAVVEGDDTAGQGVYVIEAQNATVTKTIAASDPSDDRIDLVVLQNYDDEADSSGNNDAEVEVIEGTPAGSPSAPSLPDSAIPLAEVLVGAGVTAITDANITDARSEANITDNALLDRPWGVLGETKRTSNFQTTSTSFVDLGTVSVALTGLPADRRLKISAMFSSVTHSAPGRWSVEITDGSNTRLQVMTVRNSGTNAEGGGSMFVTDAPSSGSKTYKLRVRATDAGTVTFNAGSTEPIILLVEDIGPA